MDTSIDNSLKDHRNPSSTHNTDQPGQKLPSIDITIVCVLSLVALLPRILLAGQLDVVADEFIYILGGKIDLPLVRHLFTSLGSSGWSYNYEHPPFVKLLIGLTITLNATIGHPLVELMAARIPSILSGTLLVVAVYLCGRSPLGRVVALLAALSLAVSPWLVYFSALAYLDMTTTMLITVAYLLLWHAIHRPQLYLVVAILLGLAFGSKYTSALAVPGMILFLVYYFLLLRPRLPAAQRPPLPWHWWIGASVLAPLTFLASDPAIWPRPISLLRRSFAFEWTQSVNGHLTFLAGQASEHMPHWAIFYIIGTKMSAFITVSATFFVLFALVQLVRFHLHTTTMAIEEAWTLAFVLIWVVSIIGMYSLLNIVVGTHYHLPLAAPVAVAGAAGLTTLFRYQRSGLFALRRGQEAEVTPPIITRPTRPRVHPRAALILIILTILMMGSHLYGLVTVHEAEGYTSEFFRSEDTALQVAYPGYREAVQWIATQTDKPAHIGLVAFLEALGSNIDGVSWQSYNKDLPARFTFTEAHPTDKTFAYDYLIWPMHLVQRGYTIPALWHAHIIHIVMGGNTIYCYIMAHPSGAP